MPRFVILEHDHPELHWDLMLEAGPVLRTWRLAAPPQPGRAVAARRGRPRGGCGSGGWRPPWGGAGPLAGRRPAAALQSPRAPGPVQNLLRTSLARRLGAGAADAPVGPSAGGRVGGAASAGA